jgi:hypothetical protein
MIDDREPTEAEIEAFERDNFLEDPGVSADQCPRLWNVSAGMIYQRVLRALESCPPEYVTVSLPHWRRTDVELGLAIADGTCCGKRRSTAAGSSLKSSSRLSCAR